MRIRRPFMRGNQLTLRAKILGSRLTATKNGADTHFPDGDQNRSPDLDPNCRFPLFERNTLLACPQPPNPSSNLTAPPPSSIVRSAPKNCSSSNSPNGDPFRLG